MRNTTPTQSVEMLLRALFEGTEADTPWVNNRSVELEMEALAYHEALDMPVPYQYLLLTLSTDETRAVTREAAQAARDAADRLLALLKVYERATNREHPEWAKFIALLEAPFPVKIPPNCDTRDPDVIAVMIRDVQFEGSWEKNLDWMALHGSEEQRRIDGARIRQLAAFEETYGVNLADLLFSEEAKAEHAQLAEDSRRSDPGLPPLYWKEN